MIRFNKKDGKAIQFYHEEGNHSSLNANSIRDILINSKGEIWIATFGGGVDKILIQNITSVEEKENYSFVHYTKNENLQSSLSDNEVITLFEDKDENLWIGTYHGGLNKFEPENKSLPPEKAKFIHYSVKEKSPASLCSNTVMALAQDQEGFLWIGTFGGGLDKLNVKSGLLSHYHRDKSGRNRNNILSDDEVLSLYMDRSGILWVGSHLGEGVTKIQRNYAKFELINSRSSEAIKLNDDVVWSVYKDRKENLWVGTYRGGLNKLDFNNEKSETFFNDPDNPNSLSSDHIRSIAEDNFGNIWIGTYNAGLNRLDPDTKLITVLKNEPGNHSSLSANQILDIYVESDSIIWAATYGGGLNKLTFRKNTNGYLSSIKIYKHTSSNPHSISDDRVYIIYKDKK
jgi:ligand-binding sensor domain-containing protein